MNTDFITPTPPIPMVNTLAELQKMHANPPQRLAMPVDLGHLLLQEPKNPAKAPD